MKENNSRKEGKGTLTIKEYEQPLDELVVGELYSKPLEDFKEYEMQDDDYLVIEGFLKEDVKAYEIGFGIIDKSNKEIEAVKSYEIDEERDLAVFVYNCNLDRDEIIGREVILRDRRNQLIWGGFIREIPRGVLKFSKHSKGNCYICHKVININTIENKSNAAIAVVKGNDKNFSVLSIKRKINNEDEEIVNFNKGIENKNNDIEKKVQEKAKDVKKEEGNETMVNNKVSTELKHYIDDRAEEITKNLISEVIKSYPVEIINRKKTDTELDGYVKITALEEKTIVTINQKNDVETVISYGENVMTLAEVFAYILKQ